MKIKYYLLFVYLLLFSLIAKPTTYTAVGCPGPVNWGGFASGTSPFWNAGVQLISQPLIGDILVIPSGCTVTINASVNVTNDITIEIYGQLKFSGSSDKLNLDDGSRINVYSSGSITGPSNSNQIKIGSGGAEWSGPGQSSGPFSITNGVLPIELVEFYATEVSTFVQLNWRTASEKNNDYFELEHSKDGVHFELLEKIESKSLNGTSLQNLVYETLDRNPENDINYYRLRQVDFDKKFTLSKIISLTYKEKTDISFIIYPNPNQGEFSIKLKGQLQNQHVGISIIDKSGKIVYTTNTDSDSIKNQSFKINVETVLKVGTYHMVFLLDNSKYNSKLLIK